MYFNRKNAEQKNWRMIKKGKHFLFGCSLVFAVGAALVAPTVKADTADTGEVETKTANSAAEASSSDEVGTYKAPAVEVSTTSPVVAEHPTSSEATSAKTAKEADGVQLPSLTVVADSSALTDEEKANVVAAVKGVNPTATDVQVQADGSVVVTFADGSTANLTASQTVKVAAPAETSATQPKSRSRRAAGQERAQDRSSEEKDIKYVYKDRTATVNDGDPTQRAKIEYRQLGDYEVVDGKTVATDPSGQGRPVLEWTVTFNEAQYDKMGGYYYFTIPKNVSDPYKVVTEYNNGAYGPRDGWVDGNVTPGGSPSAEGQQFIDAGNKLEWRVKNTVGGDYNNVNGLSGVMNNTKKVYVLSYGNNTKARMVTIKYRTVVEDPSQTISYIAGVESKTGLPRNNWYAISGKYDKQLVSQVAAPSVTPNLTNTSVNVPVQTVASTSSTLSGTGVPGATIKIYIDGQEQNIGNVTVDSSGNWTTGELPTALNNNQGDGTTIKPRQTVEVSQVVNGEESSRRTVPVSVGVTTVEPSSLTTNQAAVVAGQKEVTLKVPHDAGIAYMRYTNTAGETVEIPVKRDNASSAWTSQKSDKATVKSVEHGKFQDTIVLTMADKIAGTEVAAISNVVEGGFSSVADWQPRSVENQAPTIASAVEGNKKTVAQGAQLDLASLVTVADKEDDAQATLGDKVHAEVVSVNGDTATKTVDTNTQGTYTVKYKAVDSQGKESNEIEVTVVVNPARDNVAPTVEIPYSNKAEKEVYVYGGEANSFDIKFKDDSGKIASATVNAGGNQAFKPVEGEANKINTQFGFKANVISAETPATADAPAVITYSGTPAPEGKFTQNDLDAATRGENPKGVALGWRYATATDTDGAKIENGATSASNPTDPGAFRVMLKGQTQKYDIVAPTEKVAVADPTNVTDDDLAKIKEKLQLEYSKTNDDANLADKKGQPVADKDAKIKSVEKDADGNLVVTYKDGSQDKKPLSEFVTKDTTTPARDNVAPTVEIPYSNKATKEVYVYGGEANSFDIKFKDDSGKIASATVNAGGNQAFKPVEGEANKINTQFGFKANVISTETPATAETPAVITYSGTPAPEGKFTQNDLDAATRGENPKGVALGWRYATATDTDGAKIENGATSASNPTDPGAFRVMLKAQTQKYDIATPTEKVTVADPANVTKAELDKIKEKLQLEYSQNNDDANLADKKGKAVDAEDAKTKIKSVEKDAAGNLVVTYTDGSQDKKPLSEFVTKKPTDADKNEPTPKAQTVDKGTEPKAEDSIGNLKDLPKGTTVAFKEPVDTATPGEKPATVVVTYPDGSTDEVPVKVTVQEPSSEPKQADKNEPTPKAQTVDKGTEPKAEDSIGNLKDLPKGTTVAFKEPVDTATPGEKPATVVVTYPDGSTDEVPVKVTVQEPSSEPKQADKNEPTPKAQTVDKGTEPKAEDSIGNLKDLPKGTTVAFKEPVDTATPGEKPATVVVTYPDGSTDEVPVKVTVQEPSSEPKQADKNEPTPKAQTVDKGTEPKAEDSIGNLKDLPKGTTVAFKEPVDTATPGEKPATVVVTYPDGSTDEVPVKVTVQEPSSEPKQADKNEPTPKAQTVDKGTEPKAEDSIGNLKDLPKGTTVAFKEPVDTATPGEKPATVVVTYPDGSTDEVPVKVTVQEPSSEPKQADKNEPTPKAQTVDKGTEPKAEDSIGNLKDLPKGTTVAFKDPVDTATPGEKPATAVVTYPDGSKEEVPVKVTVTDPSSKPTDADKNEPTPKAQTVDKGTEPKAEDSIGNLKDLPKGTTVAFKDPVDTTTPGEKPATAVVTYPDGSKEEVPVKVTVTDPSSKPTDADKNEPTPKAQTVDKGTEPKAEDSIGNLKDLPKGTTVAFKEPVDTATPGEKPATVVVTYPDGSTDEVPVKVTVQEPSSEPKQADKNEPTPKAQTVDKGTEPKAEDSIGNLKDLPKGTTVAFKEPVDTATPGEKPATVVVTYPDGSTDEVPVKVTVQEPSSEPKQADKNEPTPKAQTVDKGTEPKAEDSIGNLKDLPKGTTVAFKEPVDTATPGEKPATVVVTYPDGSTDEVPVKVTVQEPSSEPKQADKNEPTPKAQTVDKGTEPKAEDSIGNLKDLPKGTTVAFKDPVDTATPGEKPATAVVTYPDGSKEEVPVKVTVTDPSSKPTDADKNEPTPKAQTVDKGTEPKAEDSIGNLKDLPKGTTVAFKDPVDTTTPGEKPATAVVTYPDGSKEEVPVKVTVTDPSSKPTDADKNEPTPKAQTVDKGTEPKAEDSIGNLKDLPKGTTVAFKDPVDTTTPGEKPATAVVTYPDGSKEEVPVKVTVTDPSSKPTDADKNEPTPKAQTVDKGTEPKAEDSIGNLKDLPKGTTVAFKDPVDTATPGEKPATAVVTYPDGSKEEVPVKVTVTDPSSKPTDADKNEPTPKAQTVDKGTEPKAEDSIGNLKDLPKGTTVAFKDPVDTATPGEKPATAVVTYPDGSKEEVPVKVTVTDPSSKPTDADKNEPTPKAQTVDKGTEPKAEDSIGNLKDLPKGTTVAFKDPVDTTTPGEKPATAVVTYPDGSKEEVPVKVTVTDPSSKPTDADKNEPTPKAQTVDKGTEPKAEDSIGNLKDLPKGTTVAFKDPVDTTTPGEKPATAVVTYPDGSKEEVPVKVTVTDPSSKPTDADKNEPTPKAQTVDKGTEPKAEDSIGNLKDLPKGTTVAFKDPVDTATPGEKPATAVVTYPDGSKEEVPVKVTVTDPSSKPTDADKNEPTPKAQTVDKGTEPKAEDSIGNLKDLPKGTTVAFKDPVDTTTPGEKPATAVVTYPDGSKEEVPVKVTVTDPSSKPTDADKNEPTPKAQTVDKGTEPKAEDSIGNLKDLPKGTTVAFKDPVDTTTPGEKPATAVVTYPDGSKEEVPVKVTVTDPSSKPTDADKNEPTPKAQTVDKGTEPKAEDSIGNLKDLPKGTTVAFKDPVDTTTPGEKPATAVVTYPDGSKEEVPVKVTVTDPSSKPTDADKNEPTPKAQTVDKGTEPKAEDSIGNLKDLPKGTTVAFKDPVDTTTPGEKPATAVVTYPDGSKEEVPVKVTVTDPSSKPTDADKNEPTPKAQTVDKGTEPKAEDSIGNLKDLPKGTTVAFKDPVDTTTPGEKPATAVVTYPDGSKEEVPVKVTVTDPSSKPTDADKNEPTPKAQTVDKGTEPKAEDSIGNLKDLPKGTTVAFKDPVDTTTPGEKPATAVVTYPDGSKEEVPVKVTVTDPSSKPTDADKNEPTPKAQTVDKGTEPKAEDSIGNLKDLPKGTTVAFKDPVDTTTPGEKPATAVVTYPDGSKEEVPVKVTVQNPSSPATDADNNKVTDPAVTPVKDPANLTDAEKAKVADEVKKSNPTAKDVEVGKDGKTTVTYPDGTTAVIPADKTVKKSDDKAVKDPSVTPVTDPSNLTDAEKAKVADEVKKSNPTAKDVEVGKDGKTTVTYPDGTTAVIPADKTVKKSDDKAVKDPSVTPVTDPSNLTDAEKAKVADEVKKSNPTAKDVEVGKDGKTTVTYPDGTTAVIPADKTVKKSDDKAVKDPSVTPVTDPSNLTDAEKAKVADEVKKSNPTAKDVEVGKDGKTTVTYPDGTTAVIPADKTVKKSDDKAVKDPSVTPVTDPSNLTDAEKAKVADEVKKSNPTAKDVEVGKDGKTTVTYPDGTTAVIPADKTVKKSDDKGTKDPSVTPVTDPSNLTDAEKAKVADEVKKSNPTAKDVEVGKDGKTTVTYPDGTTAVIPADKTVKKSDDKAVKDPSVTPVTDPSNLTDAEKAKVADEVKKSNPTAKDVEVGKDGKTTVTYPDGTTAVIPADKTVKKSDDKAVKDPSVTPVTDPSNLTDAEKAKVADEVKKSNPTAKDVEVGKDGKTTVTYPDGTTAVIPADKTVKKSDDKAVKDPSVTPVTDPSNLTDAEKAKVADEVKKSNPTAKDVEVGKDGKTTVTYPDGTTAVIPADKTVKKSDDKGTKDPSVTPVTDPSNLTDAEKAKVADEVKKSNPTAKDVEVGKDGKTTVTYPDGTTAVIPADKTVKKSDDKAVKDPSVTPVTDPSNLTDAEKAKVADEVKKSNPTAKDVEVGKDGKTTVTYPDGTTAVIPADKTVKKSDDKAVKDPSVTPVTDPSNLTDAEKAKVADEVKKSNPTAKDVEVGKDGKTTVTYPDGTTAVIPADKTVKKSDDKAVKDPSVTPVTDPSNLTDAEKAKVADEVKKSNPTAKDVEVGKDGKTTVTYPDGTTAVIPADKTVKKSDDKAVKDPSVTPVTDPSNLTDAEKAKVADEVKKSNPTAKDVEVGKDGKTTVTYPDGTTAVIPADKTVKKSDDKAVKDPSVTPVTDPSNLTDAEKAKVADEVKKSNPTAKDVEVGKDGKTTVTYPDGTTAVIPADKAVKKSADKAVKDPSVTPVTDPSNLTDAEKAKVADEVKKANPTAKDVEVGKDGKTTVTYPDGTTAVIPADKTVKKSDDKAVKDPSVTPVTDPSNLTDAEKAKVADEVKKSNPTAKDVEVGKDGKTTVTYPDGTTAVIPADKAVKKSADKAVKDPSVTPVTDPSNLTDAEKAKVADEVKKSNPTAKDIKVNKDGSVVVTFEDGTTAVIPADKTVKKSADKVVTNPSVTPVTDSSNLTDAEKAKVADEVKKANPTAKDIKVNKDGSVVVTFEDGTTAVIPADKTVKKSSDKVKESDGVKNPSVTPVTDPSNLTDAEKAKVADEVKKANPTAKDIKVNNDGSVVVTFEDGSVAVIPAEKAVTTANQDSPAQAPAKKAGAKELPNTGTEQSSASLALALLAAATGGLLFAKKREEEE